MNQRSFTPILIIAFITAVIGGYLVYSGKINLNQSQSPTQVIPTINGSNLPTPTASTTSNKRDPWQKYESGTVISGLSFQYPAGWVVNYRKEFELSKDYKAKYRLSFDFAPPGWKSPNSIDWLGWGDMFFDVYELQTDINQWIDQNLSEYKLGLETKEIEKIGNQPTYRVKAKEGYPWSDAWKSRSVILGQNYSYELTFSEGYFKNSTDNFIEILNKDIIPSLHIK